MPATTILVVMVAASLAVAIFVSWPLLVARREEEAEGEEEADLALDQLLVQKEATYSAIKELEFDHAMGNLSQEDYRELARRYEDRAVALLQIIDEISGEEPHRPVGSPPAVAGVMLGAGQVASLDTGTRRCGYAETRQQATGNRQQEMRGRGDAENRQKAPGPRHRADLDDEIERQVARFRHQAPGTRHQDTPDEEIERQVAALRAEKAVQPRPERVVAAPGPLRQASCPSCSAPLKNARAAFCSRCGTALRASCPACGQAVDVEDSYCSFCGGPLAPAGDLETKETVVGGADA